MIEFFIGVLVSVYTGYILYKFTEFRALREEACRAIFELSTADKWIKPLRESGMSMKRHGHVKASDTLFNIASEIDKMYGKAPKTVEEIKAVIGDVNGTLDNFHAVQSMRLLVKQLKPSKKVLFLPNLA